MFGYRLTREKDYDKLVAERDQLTTDVRQAESLAAAANARAEYLRVANNALEQDCARLRAIVTKVPHTAVTMEQVPQRDSVGGKGVGIPGMDASIFEDVDDLADRYARGESVETLLPMTRGVQHQTNEGTH
jgi:hypothetical protein